MKLFARTAIPAVILSLLAPAFSENTTSDLISGASLDGFLEHYIFSVIIRKTIAEKKSMLRRKHSS